MYGPAYGHNIETFIEYFQHHKNYKVDFVFTGDDDFAKDEKYAAINFIKIALYPHLIIQLIFLIRKKPDLMWVHASNIYHLLFLNFFRSKKTILNINIWSEKVPRLAAGNSFKGKLWKYILDKADYVQCNWYGTKKLVNEIVDTEVVVFPWGLHQDYFEDSNKEISKIAQDFVNGLPTDKVKFFYPKSITFASDHVAVVDATYDLVQKGVTNFVVYFWMGNVLDKGMELNLRAKINELNLNDYINIEQHNYISYSDIKFVWSKMDVGMQIAIFDQFSTSVIEPMLMQKELVITKIDPYIKLIELYPKIALKLTERSAVNISKEMNNYILGERSTDEVLNSRAQMVKDEFNFNENLEKMLLFYEGLTKNKS
jgi:hypothetical protein